MRRPFRGLGAILFKEFIVVLRDPMTLFFMFFPPLIEMIAFGYALDNDVKHMAMVVFNEDRTVESRQLLDHFVNTETFRDRQGSRQRRRSWRARSAPATPMWDCRSRRISPATSAPDAPLRCSS